MPRSFESGTMLWLVPVTAFRNDHSMLSTNLSEFQAVSGFGAQSVSEVHEWMSLAALLLAVLMVGMMFLWMPSMRTFLNAVDRCVSKWWVRLP